MKYDPEIHHRRSTRLKGYDYSQPGAYFVTICAFQRDEIFGEIRNGDMKLSALGQIAREEWLRSSKFRKEIQIFDDEYVIMPNHLHGIVRIIGPVWTDGARSAPQDTRREMDTRRASLRRAPRSLGSFVAGFKASVTSRAKRELNITGIWQRNYFEHIVRNEAEFNNIWKYIDTNPLHWQADRLYTSALPNRYNQD